MDLPNTRLWRDTSRPMASSPRTALLSHLKKITGARSKSALTENAPYKACSGFTRVMARWIAGPPEAAFVTRLRPVRLPVQAARQLPDQSTTLWAEPSSGDKEGFAAFRQSDDARQPTCWQQAANKPRRFFAYANIVDRYGCEPNSARLQLGQRRNHQVRREEALQDGRCLRSRSIIRIRPAAPRRLPFAHAEPL